MTEQKQPSLARNLLSSIGLMIALLALVNIAFLVFIDVGAQHANPYVGIFAYVLMPGVLCGGLALFILGMLLERRRRRRRAPDAIPAYPDINLNNPRTRRTVELSIIGISVFLLISVFGSYKAYHYTETDQFCGTTCHQVMHPEFTAYKASPHARVGCVNCHIGSGATWYVKSKLSGAYQLYATAVNNYPRPIPTPVENLRPAQETCEQCHWPEKFWGAQLKTFEHYQYDETSTPHETKLLIKTGGGGTGHGPAMGIHWHMNIANEVTYIATDKQRQKIDWVQFRNRQTGRTVIYKRKGSALTDAQIAAMPKRVMDCVDCHNRPTHIYTPPDRSVDRAIFTGSIARELPYIKQQAVAALIKPARTTEEGVAAIAKDLDAYYRTSYPDLHRTKKKEIDRAAATLQAIYRTTIFPEMKVDWRTHPNNVGHMYSPGCFRCHDSEMVSAGGTEITRECSSCHDALGREFEHPVDLGDLRFANCSDCHSGGSM